MCIVAEEAHLSAIATGNAGTPVIPVRFHRIFIVYCHTCMELLGFFLWNQYRASKEMSSDFKNRLHAVLLVVALELEKEFYCWQAMEFC